MSLCPRISKHRAFAAGEQPLPDRERLVRG